MNRALKTWAAAAGLSLAFLATLPAHAADLLDENLEL